MAVTATMLREEVKANTATTDAQLNGDINVADTLLRKHIEDGGAEYASLPITIVEKAWLLVAAEVFHQRRAPNGVLNQTYASPDGGSNAVPVRIGADPLHPAIPLLKHWLSWSGFA